MDSKPPRFYLPTQQSPTYYNLSHYLQSCGWRSSYFRYRAIFSEQNLNFDTKAAQCLEYKHLLAQLVSHHCPETMPLTYCINDDNWPQILALLSDNFYRVHGHIYNSIDNLAWILKPALLNNGQGIKIFQTLDKLEQHFLSHNRLGGEQVLQQYITNPHLLRDRRKYSIRQFLVLTNYMGAFLYRDGYFNVALSPFLTNDFSDLKSHLTNEHLYGDIPNVIQIPSYEFASYSTIYPQIKKLLICLISGLHACYPQAFSIVKQRVFALFGADFMLDNMGRAWLLEVNHGPCFPIAPNHPLQTCFYKDFWLAVINSFVLPIANNVNAQLDTKSIKLSINKSIFDAIL